VTPSFSAYASGHSTFSRAAAEVLVGFTGSEYFPGGISGYTIKAGSLKFEAGPTTDIHLEWATYYDAADQAGQSRLWGGIHIQADDFTGSTDRVGLRQGGLESGSALLQRCGRVVTVAWRGADQGPWAQSNEAPPARGGRPSRAIV
jgi:hypothetical protein